MKQLLTVLFLTLATIAKSQDTIKIPVPIAHQIAKDLVIGDSAIAVLDYTTKRLVLTEDKVVLKDSIIEAYKQKCAMYDTMLANSEKKFLVQKAWTEDLRRENRKLKIKLLYTKISMSAIAAFLGYLLIK